MNPLYVPSTTTKSLKTFLIFNIIISGSFTLLCMATYFYSIVKGIHYTGYSTTEYEFGIMLLMLLAAVYAISATYALAKLSALRQEFSDHLRTAHLGGLNAATIYEKSVVATH